MKDLRHVFFNLGHARLKEAQAILAKSGVLWEARLEKTGILAGSCRVTLAADDQRLQPLLDHVRQVGESPLIRAERTFTERELDQFEWLVLRIATSGLLGGINLGQPYDRSRACSLCGTGSRPLPPIIADLSRMGKKLVDRTSHDGLVIAAVPLVHAITQAGLTGFAAYPSRRRSDADPDPRFHWLDITAEWDRMVPRSVLETDGICPMCSRSGHYDAYERVTEFWYQEPPEASPDFNHTWEYFGWSYTYARTWAARLQNRESGGQPLTGGHRLIIVSQRVRACFKREKVRRVVFEPIWFLSEDETTDAV